MSSVLRWIDDEGGFVSDQSESGGEFHVVIDGRTFTICLPPRVMLTNSC